MNKATGLLAFQWPVPQDAFDRRTIHNIKEHGCQLIEIQRDQTYSGPLYVFSVGLYCQYQHPEIIIFGLESPVAKRIINDIATDIRKGTQYSHEHVSGDVIDAYNVTFLEVEHVFYQHYIGYALWFYKTLNGQFPLLQMIWPDSLGRFPWETGFDQQLKAKQPILNVAYKLRIRALEDPE